MPSITAPRPPLPDLPNLFRPVIALREGADAMARAVQLAPEHGAGTLAWVSALRRVEAAVVLEPELPLAAARLALLAGANALADALAALGPPEALLRLRWPATLLLNHGICGAARLAAPPGAAADAVPDWLVLGMELRLAFPQGHEPGLLPGETAMAEEGFEEATDGAALTAAWARHLMAGLDAWASGGAAKIAEPFLARLEDADEMRGARRGIDPATGALVLDRDGVRTRLELPA